jgi:drug/metabolite transporter (DMT)-like permease
VVIDLVKGQGQGKGDIMEMVFELFLIGSVGIIGLQYLVTANMDGLNAAVVTIFTIVVPLMFGIVVVYRWYKRVA